jgi:hypothetical protein
MDTTLGSATAMSPDEIITFLDGYRADEITGAALFRGWAASSKSEALRGALRVMELREHSHAQLLEQRVRELGGTPKQQRDVSEFFAFLTSPTISDAAKAQDFVSKAPPERVVSHFSGYADRMGADPESQSLLRAIIEDERATLCTLDSFAKTLPTDASAN